MSDATDRTLSIEKTLHAPIQLVWDAWTQAEHIIKWWAPPGMKAVIVAHDFQVGGHWKYTMAMPNGGDFITEGQYQEIEAPSKIVTSADFKPMTEGVTLVVELEAHGDHTHLKFSVIHPTAEYAQQQEAMGFYNGWGGTFDRLEGFLSSGS